MSARRTIVLVIFFMVAAVFARGAEATARQRRSAKDARRTAKVSRARAQKAPLSARQKAFKEHVVRALDPWGQAERTQIRLSRQGGTEESFTFSNGRVLVRGRVYEKLGGIGMRVHEMFNKVNGRWVPTENAFE